MTYHRVLSERDIIYIELSLTIIFIYIIGELSVNIKTTY